MEDAVRISIRMKSTRQDARKTVSENDRKVRIGVILILRDWLKGRWKQLFLKKNGLVNHNLPSIIDKPQIGKKM